MTCNLFFISLRPILQIILLTYTFINPSKLQETGEAYGAAVLQIEWTYSNPGSRLEDGSVCDRIGPYKCDVFFTLCLRNAAATATANSQLDECQLLQHTTKIESNTEYISVEGDQSVFVSLPQPVPNEFYFKIGAFDNDVLVHGEHIGTFVAERLSLFPTNAVVEVPLTRTTQNFKNPNFDLSVRMRLWCTEHYYGIHCTEYCKPEPQKYSCDSSGNRICHPGLQGKLCDREDSCYYEPCAPRATCVNHEDQSGRTCICDGVNKSECYPNYDPCSSSPCLNGGQCKAVGEFNESFHCDCVLPWAGHRCTNRRSACTEEAMKLLNEEQYSFNETNGIPTALPEVCMNGGTCFENSNKFEVRCVCLPGWTGPRCESTTFKDLWFQHSTLLSILLVGLSMLVVAILVVAGFVWRHLHLKRLKKQGDKYCGIIYYHNNRDSAVSEMTTVPLTQQFVNNVYGNLADSESTLRTTISQCEMKPTCGQEACTDDYDECDPLGVYAGRDIYGAELDPLPISNKILKPLDDPPTETVPPLPRRPTAPGQSFVRPSGDSFCSKSVSSTTTELSSIVSPAKQSPGINPFGKEAENNEHLEEVPKQHIYLRNQDINSPYPVSV